MQVQFLRAQQAAVVEQLTAEQLAACPNEFLCPISLEIMYFPVILVATGQTYDLTSIDAWVSSGGNLVLAALTIYLAFGVWGLCQADKL